jgi:Na+/H+-dicarboxylate symporter
MSKLLAMVATLKAILIASCVAFARGDMLSVILISVLFNLAELGAKPVGQMVARNSVAGFGKQRSRSLISNSPQTTWSSR